MPSAKRFILKDSPAVVRELVDADKLQGRTYSSEMAQQKPNAVQAAEVALGLQLACLAITDDEPDTLKNVSKANPWQTDALLLLTGSEEAAHQPLSHILQDKYNLTVDHLMDISGLSPAGHLLDTQGYIAHNDTTIVLAYRCTTTTTDWLTNLSMTTSAWEIDEDAAQGHSGWFSSCCGFRLCEGAVGAAKPRVHTGFYNNLLTTIPLIEQYIDPLLAPDQPPRTLYVVGHSLGGGIATLAGCYFLLERERYNWSKLPHQLRVVTAGGPRAATRLMQEMVDARIQEINTRKDGQIANQVAFLRVVRDKDVVPTVPPELLGFRHIPDKMIYLTKEDAFTNKSCILINPNPQNVVPKRKMEHLKREHPELFGTATTDGADLDIDETDSDDNESREVQLNPSSPTALATATDVELTKSKSENAADGTSHYTLKYTIVPRSFRDHMPQFYLHPVLDQLTQERTPQIYLDPALADLLQKDSTDQKEVEEAKEVQSEPGKKRGKFFKRFRQPKEVSAGGSA